MAASMLKLFGNFLQKDILITLRLVSSATRPYIREASTGPPSPETLLLNDSSVKQILNVCSDGSRLRLMVEGGGCSGFQYKFSLDDPGQELAGDDICIKYKGAQLVTDEDSLEYVKGSTVDYNTELIRSSFRIIDNPQAEQGCSCGASFAIKD